MSDKIDRKTATQATTSAALKGVVAATGFGIMTPTRPFGEVLDHADRDERRNDNRENEDRKAGREERESSATSESSEGDSKSVRGGNQDEVGGVARLKTKKQSPEQQFVEGKAVKPEAMTLRDAGAHGGGSDRNSGSSSVQPKNNTTHTAATMANAEQALKQLDEAIPMAKGKTLPPEILNQLVTQISSSFVNGDRQMFIRFQKSALGGNLAARIRKDDKGSTTVAFEGDTEVLAFLEAHQDELQDALKAKGHQAKLAFL